ncbi:hypothetical protein PanWU01x14_133180 [Parasponia andersonii]|uniref:Uncharacterized protein n=1 Tax=Parasponia andersonii TaxID=3476 RepID=A0A2P5CQ92_PARAD|nr:hypothetical protein PanWU01x14_133180 [Parasponia andersonii]
MIMLDSCMSVQANNYKFSPHEICSHHPHISGYYPEMPTQYELNPGLVKMRGQDFTTSVLVGDYRSSDLEDISQFHTPVEDEEINDEANIGASCDAASIHVVESSN